MSKQWPENICFKTFCQLVKQEPQHLYTELFLSHSFSIRNQRIAVKNLQIICEATFSLANEVGFQAMTLRQLSKQTAMSMGGLYAYIKSKDDLAYLIYSFLNSYCEDKLERLISDDMTSRSKLIALIHGHIYLSELMQPWFYFAYMETKNLSKEHKGWAFHSEVNMETRLFDTIQTGMDEGYFKKDDFSTDQVLLTTSLIKAMLQDWYLKPWKYKKRKVTVDQYARQVVAICLQYLQVNENDN